MKSHVDEHRIRLRGPWEFMWLKPPAGLPDPLLRGKIDFPATWKQAFDDAAGAVRVSRRFGRPTGLDDGERVWLEVVVNSAEASVLLNGEWVATVSGVPVRIEVTDRLDERNRLDLDLARTDAVDSGRPLAVVNLIVCSSV